MTFIVGARLYVSSDSKKWQILPEAGKFDGALIHLTRHRSNPGHLIAVTQYMKVLRSRDGGLTWKPFAR